MENQFDEKPVFKGPWGPVPDVILCLLPILFLIPVTMFKKILLPTRISLPLSALLMWMVRLMYLKLPANLTNSAVIYGVFDAMTPLSVIGGAILLFTTMEATKCMPFITSQIKYLSRGHPVAEVFMIAWGFAYMIEGASGFGTPVALASPMLASLGHDPFKAVVCCLLMNTVATQFGAVGTPIWFGLDGLGLTEDNQLQIGFRVSVIVMFASFVVPVVCSSFLLSWTDIRRSIIFILLSISSVVLPAVGLAYFSYEFPSLVGGMIGLLITAILAYFNVGLKPFVGNTSGSRRRNLQNIDDAEVEMVSKGVDGDLKVEEIQTNLGDSNPKQTQSIENSPSIKCNIHCLNTSSSDSSNQQGDKDLSCLEKGAYISEQIDQQQNQEQNIFSFWDAVGRTFPLWGTVLILVLTRVEQLRIKKYLRKKSPYFTIDLGTFADLRMSASLVVTLAKILSESTMSWSYELLYVPCIIPFVLVSCITILIYRKDMNGKYFAPFQVTMQRISQIFVALEGALVLVALLRTSSEAGNDSPAYIIGFNLADWLEEGFAVISLLLGGLGSFFSGSTTVSNLTFGVIQQVAAFKIDVSQKTMLAMQTAGATMGNCVCINNIIGAKAVMNMNSIPEGEFIRRTAPVAFLFYLIGTGVGCIILFGLNV
eukprot:TRINITY_DN1400_c0_g1_i5.p1 TRINITY_DN1400_c0_g1~~TRINITY_DN1400_c0_g1_i5.p1  ORF type:complete len:652 (-),score=59.12 TRINITY_DN1400_c0_g1_i5:471-2426(-)